MPPLARRYDLDWLRIGAFGLLILYHLGMVFVPWDFHIKTAQPVRWLEAPMLLLNAWRLPLLFLISGIASRVLLAKIGAPGKFARDRTRRLFVPLVAGMVLWIAPQAWVDATVNHGYRADFGHFWLNDNWNFDDSLGISTPTWNQLWFVAYLWIYTLVAAVIAAVAPVERLQSWFDTAFGGIRLLVLPWMWFALTRIALVDRWPEDHGLVVDWYAHLTYGFAFAFGLMLGGTRTLWSVIARWWRLAGAAAIVAWLVVVWVDLSLAETETLSPLALAAARTVRQVQCWGAIVGLLGFAQAYLAHDHLWRTTLNAAVFPAYIAHQTVIIVGEFWLRPFALPAWAEFAILLPATVAGSAVFYLVGRAVPWLRPLVGLSSGTPAAPAPRRTSSAGHPG